MEAETVKQESADRIREIVPDVCVRVAFEGTNFGNVIPRDVIKYSLLKYAAGYLTGKTARLILIELGLIFESNNKLTKKGKEYLYLAFYKNNSY